MPRVEESIQIDRSPQEVWDYAADPANLPVWNGGSRLEPAGDGTKFTSWIETGAMGGFFGKMGDPIVAKMYGRQVRSDLENLKEILENQ